MEAPVVKKPIPDQIINELAAFGPFDLKYFIECEDSDDPIKFSAELSTGAALPTGMILTADGELIGIPAKATQGTYEIKVTAENEAGYVEATFALTIKPSMVNNQNDVNVIKAQIWEALQTDGPTPELAALLNRAITPLDIYYLLERWCTLTLYDAYNLDAPGPKKAMTLEGNSKYFNIYDRGSCIVVSPKDLFSHERTLNDAIQATRAAAREVFKRGWTVELIGFEKLSRAAWVELNLLGLQHGKEPEILNFNPTSNDIITFRLQRPEGEPGPAPD